ncbi:Type II secretion system protein F [Fervidicola ferrireducens]|uniref:Type II secretion system protein F n=1 Tax=Fervidicola ferrireducens TaxID=520764 RepID=A0A140L648_9FIRM|nr:type II secretion system F family protein [Fervidicola ferrireducens]KXG76023.1 Type II secretion system protein F [Fervidicola ferrireducens]
MATYRYRARGNSGELITGQVEAENEAEALQVLEGRGLFVVDFRAGRALQITSLAEAFFNRVKKQDLSVFCRQLATMIGAGIPIVRALELLAEQSEKRAMRQSIERILESLREGSTFHEALERQHGIFPPIMVHSVEAAEISGSLENTLEELSEHLARDHELEEKIKSTLAYPAIIISLTAAVLMVLLVFVIPAFQNVMNSLGVPLPLPTRIVLHTGMALRRGWYLIIILISGLAFFTVRSLKSESVRRRMDELLLKMPVFGNLHKKAVISRFSRTLGTLLKSGVPIMEALEVVARNVGNRVVGDVILQARENVREGKSVADTLEASGLFPPMVIAMIAVGEETGALDSLLAKVNAFYERELEEAARRLSSMLEPAMIVVLGAAVGFIVISILLPYFQIIGNMG